MTVLEARNRVRRAARDALSSSNYGDDYIDDAVQLVGTRFCRKTRCVVRATDVSLSAGSADVDLTAIIALGFRPDQLIDVYIPGQIEPLSQVDFAQLNEYQATAAASTTPQGIAFVDSTHAQVYPTPDLVYTLKMRWWERFTTWTPGDAAANGTTLNLPDSYLIEGVLTYGATAALQHNDPRHKFAAETWQKYLEYEASCAGMGNLGARVIFREKRV